jgi:hypothetical protein
MPRLAHRLGPFPNGFADTVCDARENAPSYDQSSGGAVRLCPRTIRDLVALGVFTPIRLTPRGHYRFREEEVERLASDERKVAV